LEKPKEQAVEIKKEDETAVEEEEKRKHQLALIEAALYIAGRPLDLNEISQVMGSRSKKKAKKYCDTLKAEYASKSTALEVLALRDERYVLQVKSEFTPLIKKLVNRPLLSSGPPKTLSYIAFRQPIAQKRVIDVRGQHAYGHVKMLKDMGLIASERNGRNLALKTTSYFSDYFGLTQDPSLMKRELKRIFGDALKEETQGQQPQNQQTQP
jgi:segregation and condensation protein B